MAENDNRGPNDPTPFRRPPGGRKRREPPLIDASATELPMSPQPSSEPIAASDETFMAAETRAAAPPADVTAPAEPAEPVLFGSPIHSASEGIDGLVETKPEKAAPQETPAAFEHSATAWDAPEPEARDAPEPEARDASEPEARDASEPEAQARETPLPEAETALPESDKPFAEAFSVGAMSDEIAARLDRATPFEADSRDGDDPIAATAGGPPPRARSGFSPLAILFGLVALALLGTVAWLLIVEPQRGGTRELATTVEALQTRIAALEAKSDPAAINAKVASLTSQIGALHAASDGLTKQVDDIGTKLDATTAQVALIQSKLAAAGVVAASAPAPVSAPAEIPAVVDLAPLEAKLNDLDGRLSTLAAAPKPTIPPSVDLGPTLSRINDLDNRLSTVQTTLANLPKIDLQPLQGATAGLDHRLAAIETVLSPPKSNDRVTEARATGSSVETRAAPLAVVGQAVLRSIGSGQPFGPEIDALKALGADAATLKPLEPFAAKGVPTVAALKDQWDAVEGDVLAALRPRSSGSVLDRLTAGARTLVQIRPVGAVVGEDPAAVAARIDDDLQRGNLAAALAEWSKLPERGQSVAHDWAETVEARMNAENAAQALVAKAITSLGQAKG